MASKPKPVARKKKVEEPVVELVEPIEEVPEEAIIKSSFDVASWNPKTELGRRIKSGEIKRIDDILDKGMAFLEPEIADILLPDVEMDLLLIGQSKGKFGGGQRRVFKQTQKKTMEGNKPKFATIAVVGNKDGYVGIGYGKSKETVPAREKALRNAKISIIKIRRGCGSWECGCREAHSIPFKVSGKCGSVQIELIPAPKGTGLKVEKECQKILRLAGIRDVWSKTLGKAGTKINLISACMEALQQLTSTKVPKDVSASLGITEGRVRRVA
ncbi:30S ribosomal protein S5 [Candidatus Woesearchaeota archaeon]|nr:30S ribosomal protein S5 [Candidatus Woesearchaeota archaeon]